MRVVINYVKFVSLARISEFLFSTRFKREVVFISETETKHRYLELFAFSESFLLVVRSS